MKNPYGESCSITSEKTTTRITRSGISKATALAVTILLGLISATPPLAQEVTELETGSGAGRGEIIDSAEDIAEEESEKKKKKKFPVLPIPIFITEPAIGYGLGVAAGYFHQRKGEENGSDSVSPVITTGAPPGTTTDDESKPPPVITGIAAAYTDKGSWGAGIGHMNNWKDDGIRYSGAIGYINLESTFYFLDRPFDFNLEGGLTIQDLKFRIKRSDFFVGFKWVYINAKGEFKFTEGLPVNFPEINRSDSGLAVVANWDSRDNTMTPDKGQLFQIEAWRYDETIGGDYDYWKVGLKLHSFHPFAKRFVLGLRLDLKAIDGDPPLWGYPWITLRGVPALRYQNEKTGVVEAELRWNIAERWAILGFIGAGATRGDTLIYQDESGIVAGGIGGRWLFRPKDKIWVGVDIASGPEDVYTYIQVGHAW